MLKKFICGSEKSVTIESVTLKLPRMASLMATTSETTMRKLFQFICISMLFVALIGCESDADRGPFGPAEKSALLAPFAGEWIFDSEKTLEALKSAGATDKQIEGLRKLGTENPLVGQMHANMKITGDVAVGTGDLSSEYRFFAMHSHDKKVCGKAWHHEDRFDPGDMSKCYVRLMIKDSNLYMDVKMKDGYPDSDDPDLRSSPPPEGGSAANCNAENPAGSDWSEWATYVFSRKQ